MQLAMNAYTQNSGTPSIPGSLITKSRNPGHVPVDSWIFSYWYQHRVVSQAYDNQITSKGEIIDV